MNKKTKKKVIKDVEIGAGVTAGLATALAGAYLLSGKKNQKKVNTWVSKARKEIAQNVKNAKNLGEKEYKLIVDKVMKKYASLQDVNLKEMMLAMTEAKNEWRKMKTFEKKVLKSPVKKISKKPVHKAVKAKKH